MQPLYQLSDYHCTKIHIVLINVFFKKGILALLPFSHIQRALEEDHFKKQLQVEIYLMHSDKKFEFFPHQEYWQSSRKSFLKFFEKASKFKIPLTERKKTLSSFQVKLFFPWRYEFFILKFKARGQLLYFKVDRKIWFKGDRQNDIYFIFEAMQFLSLPQTWGGLNSLHPLWATFV